MSNPVRIALLWFDHFYSCHHEVKSGDLFEWRDFYVRFCMKALPSSSQRETQDLETSALRSLWALRGFPVVSRNPHDMRYLFHLSCFAVPNCHAPKTLKKTFSISSLGPVGKYAVACRTFQPMLSQSRSSRHLTFQCLSKLFKANA